MKLTPTQARIRIRQELNKGNGIYIDCRFFDVRVKAGVLQVSDFNSWFDVEPGSEFRNGHGQALFTYEPDDSYKRLEVVAAIGIENTHSAEVYTAGNTVEVLRETLTQYVISAVHNYEMRVSKATLLLMGLKKGMRVQFKVPVSPIKPFEFGNWHAWQGTAKVMLSDESVKQLREFETVDDCINWLFINDHKDAARALNAHAKEGK